VRLDILIISTVATAGLLGLASSDVSAQTRPSTVRVAHEDAAVMSRPSHRSDLVLTAPPDSTFETLDREGDWFWILLPPDARGTQRAAWIHAGHVEGATVLNPKDDPVLKEAERIAKEAAKAEKQAAREAEELAKAEEKAEKARAADEKLQAEARAKADEKARKDQEAEARRMRKVEEELEKARKQYEKLTQSGS
jgi:hypothetical protein